MLVRVYIIGQYVEVTTLFKLEIKFCWPGRVELLNPQVVSSYRGKYAGFSFLKEGFDSLETTFYLDW